MHSLPRFLEIAKLLFVFLLRFHRVLASKNYILDLCQLPRLTFWDHKMKTPHASHGILEIYFKSPPCPIWISPNKLRNNPLPNTMTEYLPYFIVKSKIKCFPASWLSIAFSDTDLMLQFCLCSTKSNWKLNSLCLFLLVSQFDHISIIRYCDLLTAVIMHDHIHILPFIYIGINWGGAFALDRKYMNETWQPQPTAILRLFQG